MILLTGSACGSHALETPDTYWDQRGVGQFDGIDKVIDIRDGRVAAVGRLNEGPFAGSPERAAREFLAAHEDWCRAANSAGRLRAAHVAESPGGTHVRFVREIDGVPVYPGDMVVSLDKENRVYFFATSLIDIDEAVTTTVGMSAENAERLAREYLRATAKPVSAKPTELVIWAGDNREFAPCWKYHAYHNDPAGDWEVLVDANTGAIRRARDRAWNVDGSGMVFMTDPLTSSGAAYGSPGYVDNNDADSPQLTGQRVSVVLRDIATIWGLYFLSGPYVVITDSTPPANTPVMQSTPVFNFTRSHDGFEDVMCYYFIDRSQRWLQTLGFYNIQNAPLPVDPHGLSGGCFAQYVGSGNFIHFGEGVGDGCVDTAEDGEVIWHEYGHAIQNGQIPGWGPNEDDSWAIGEGFSEYWAASFGRSVSNNNQNIAGGWGARPGFTGGPLQPNYHYPEDAGLDPHETGRIWAQALYEAELASTRFPINRLVVQSHYLYSQSMLMPAVALALLSTDQSVYQGQYAHAISDGCVPRGLLTRPVNDTCPGLTIASLPYTYSGSTATADDDFATVFGAASPEVFFTLNSLPCAYNVTASLCGSGYDTGIEVRTSGPAGGCPGTALVSSNDDFCGAGSQVTFTANAGWEYYIIVHGYSTFAGPYTLNVTGTLSDPVPPNDNCPGGAVITTLPYAASGSTCTAGHHFNTCVSSVSPDVVYPLQLSSCQTVTVSLCGSQYDTGVEIRTGGSCPGAQVVACNDDFCNLGSQVQFVAAAEQPYYIIVNGYGNDRGAYTLSVTGTPFTAPNDACPGTVIASLPFTDTGNTMCSVTDYAKCVGQNSPDVVYSYTSQACQMVTVSLCGSVYDTGLEVRRRGSCPGADLVACSDDQCGLQSTVSFPASINDTYYIIVHGYALAGGPYSIQVTGEAGAMQSNDVCGGARDITRLPYMDQGHTACATNNSVNCVGAGSPDVYYRLLLESCTDVTARLCYSAYDTGLQVRTGGWCPGSDPVACNDDHIACGEGSLQSLVQFRASAGVYYYLTVHGYGSNAGFYVLDVIGATCAPESLVVQRSGNGIFLDWAPVAASGSVTYRVYRAATPDVPTLPGNLIATTTGASYTDAGIIGDPQTRHFYAVTAEVPVLLSTETEPAAASQPHDKPAPAAQVRDMEAWMLPAYMDPAAIQPPDPSKAEAGR